MKWLLKASLQKILSNLPNSEKVNYFFQHNITKSLPVSEEKFLAKFSEAFTHWKIFLKYNYLDRLEKSNFYEFGGGWDLIIPFTYSALGIKKQTIIDFRPNIRCGF